MPDIPYLTTERPTAAQMNVLFAEYDRKLALTWDNKSPFFWDGWNTLELNFISERFYFLGGLSGLTADLNQLSFDYSFNTDGTPKNAAYLDYNHQIFTDLAQSTPILTAQTPYYDAARKILRIEDIDVSHYQTINKGHIFGSAPFFDHSLEAHTRLFSPVPDAEPKPYFLMIGGGGGATGALERVRNYEQVDIILDNRSAFVFRSSWNKFNFFRIHNLSNNPIEFMFQGNGVDVFAATYTIPARGCKCVRRTRAGVYTEGYTYFQKYLSGDPLFYHGALLKNNREISNNVTNPSILTSLFDILKINNGLNIPRFMIDKTKFWDATSTYCNGTIFPTVSDSQPIGDFVHHKGKLVAVETVDGIETSRTDIAFDGYRSLKSKFQQAGLTVSDTDSIDPSGQAPSGIPGLEVSSAGEVDVATISTNLLTTQPAFSFLPSPSGMGGKPVEAAKTKFYVATSFSHTFGIARAEVVEALIPKMGSSFENPSYFYHISDGVDGVQEVPRLSRSATLVTSQHGTGFGFVSFLSPLSDMKNLQIFKIDQGKDLTNLEATFSTPVFKFTGFGPLLTWTVTHQLNHKTNEPVYYASGSTGNGVSEHGLKVDSGRILAPELFLLGSGSAGWPGVGQAIPGAFLSPRLEQFYDVYRYSAAASDIFTLLGTVRRHPYFTELNEQPTAADNEAVEEFTTERKKDGIKILSRFGDENVFNGLAAWYAREKLTLPNASNPIQDATYDTDLDTWWGLNRERLVANTPGPMDTGVVFNFLPLFRDHYNNMASLVNSITRVVPLTWESIFPRQGQTFSGFQFTGGIGPRNFRPVGQWIRLPAANSLDGTVLQGIRVRTIEDFPAIWRQWIELNRSETTNIVGELTATPLVHFEDGATTDPNQGFFGVSFPREYFWVHVEDAKNFIEALGFKFVFQEISVPVTLGFESLTVNYETRQGGVTYHSSRKETFPYTVASQTLDSEDAENDPVQFVRDPIEYRIRKNEGYFPALSFYDDEFKPSSEIETYIYDTPPNGSGFSWFSDFSRTIKFSDRVARRAFGQFGELLDRVGNLAADGFNEGSFLFTKIGTTRPGHCWLIPDTYLEYQGEDDQPKSDPVAVPYISVYDYRASPDPWVTSMHTSPGGRHITAPAFVSFRVLPENIADLPQRTYLPLTDDQNLIVELPFPVCNATFFIDDTIDS